MSYGITSAGFNKKPYSVILEEIKTNIKGISPKARFEPETRYMQIAVNAANREYALWNLFESLYSQRNINQARGRSLDDLVALNNIRRLLYKYSFIFNYEITGTPGTVIPEGFIVVSSVDSTLKFETTSEYTIGSGGSVTVTLRCTKFGPFLAPAGTVTIIEKHYLGIDSVDHTQDANPGRFYETDDELLLRRESSLMLMEGSTRLGILRALILLNQDEDKPELTYIDVQVNPESYSDTRGRPPHSVECIVEVLGDTTDRDEEIAQTIFDAVGAGSSIFGEKAPIEVKDVKDRSYFSSFTTPVHKEIYVKIDVTVTEALTTDEKTNLKSNVAIMGNNLGIGKNATVIGPNGLACSVKNSKIKTAEMFIGFSIPADQTFLSIEDGMLAIPEKAVFDTSRIEINETVV
jgi:hypothetical protein